MSIFNERFDTVFKEHGLTQEEFGKLIGASKSQVYAYRGVTNFSFAPPEILIRISEVCNVSVDWLVGRSEIRKPHATELYSKLVELSPDAQKAVAEFIEFAKAKYPDE